MKIIAVILSVLLFGMSMIPCSDGETCEDNQSVLSEPLTHDHSEGEFDHCSPFCICACCSISLSLEGLLDRAAYQILEITDQTAAYSFIYTFTYLGAVWRPPSHY